MTLDERIRAELERGAEQARISPDAWERISARAVARPRTRRLVVAASVVVVAVLGYVTAGLVGSTVVQDVVGERRIAPQTRPTLGFWPVHTGDPAALEMQRRVERGQERWRSDPVEVARAFAREVLEADEVEVLGTNDSLDEDRDWHFARVDLRPVVAGQRGVVHEVGLQTLPDAGVPVWFVYGMDNGRYTLELPQPWHASFTSPLKVRGFTETAIGLHAELRGPDGAVLGRGSGGSTGGPFGFALDHALPREEGVGYLLVWEQGEPRLNWTALPISLEDRGTAQALRELGHDPILEMQDTFVLRDWMAALENLRGLHEKRGPEQPVFIGQARAKLSDRMASELRTAGDLTSLDAPPIDRVVQLEVSREPGAYRVRARTYRGEGQAATYSDDTLTFVREHDRLALDRWDRGPAAPLEEAIGLEVHFRYPPAGGGAQRPGSSETRRVPASHDAVRLAALEVLAGPRVKTGSMVLMGGEARLREVRQERGRVSVSVTTPWETRRPQIEASLRATLLRLPGVRSLEVSFVGEETSRPR
ncbi:MAG TPA: hypothetical protein VM840_13695 [Actinomycetota bacterium]|nr:hypothetical protein [Actinomycetota bacterium]